LRVRWRNGVSIEHDDIEVILDPLNNRPSPPRVFVSHGHYDHSTGFKIPQVSKYSSRETMELMSAYGFKAENWQPLTMNEKVVFDDVEVVPHNSGHVLGSYEFEIITPEGNVLFTGDLNTEQTKTMKPAQPIECDMLVLEATFGSPDFVFPSEDLVGKEMVNWARKIMKTGRIPAFQTDPLGNAQEIVAIFNEYSIPVVTHWKVSKISRVYKAHGYKLEYFDSKTDEADEISQSSNFIFITPKQLDLHGHPEFVPALVSGWALWSRHEAFPLSDHADFPRLIRFVEQCKPKTVLTCHGSRFNETLAKYIEKKLGIRAYPINLIATSLHSKL